MSKMDDLRTMREAKYAARTAAAATKPAAKPAAKPVTKRPAEHPVPTDAGDAAEGRCGHRAISGRTCTREQGHAAKSHRYS